MRFRAKPIEIEAVQFRGEVTCKAIHDFLGLTHTDHEGEEVEYILLQNGKGGSIHLMPGSWLVKDFNSGHPLSGVLSDEAFRLRFEPIEEE